MRPGQPHSSPRDEGGQAMVEYAMIIGLIILGVAALLPSFGAAVSALYQTLTSAIPSL